MPKRLKFVVEQWVLFIVRRQTWQARRFKIFESARHFRIEWSPIRIWIECRSFTGPQLWHAYEKKKIGIFIERTTLCCLVALRETSSSRPMTRLNHQQWVHRQHHYIKMKRGRQRLELTRLRRDVSVNHRYSSLPSSHCVRTSPLTVWNSSQRAAC